MAGSRSPRPIPHSTPLISRSDASTSSSSPPLNAPVSRSRAAAGVPSSTRHHAAAGQSKSAAATTSSTLALAQAHGITPDQFEKERLKLLKLFGGSGGITSTVSITSTTASPPYTASAPCLSSSDALAGLDGGRARPPQVTPERRTTARAPITRRSNTSLAPSSSSVVAATSPPTSSLPTSLPPSSVARTRTLSSDEVVRAWAEDRDGNSEEEDSRAPVAAPSSLSTPWTSRDQAFSAFTSKFSPLNPHRRTHSNSSDSAARVVSTSLSTLQPHQSLDPTPSPGQGQGHKGMMERFLESSAAPVASDSSSAGSDDGDIVAHSLLPHQAAVTLTPPLGPGMWHSHAEDQQPSAPLNSQAELDVVNILSSPARSRTHTRSRTREFAASAETLTFGLGLDNFEGAIADHMEVEDEETSHVKKKSSRDAMLLASPPRRAVQLHPHPASVFDSPDMERVLKRELMELERRSDSGSPRRSTRNATKRAFVRCPFVRGLTTAHIDLVCRTYR